MNIMMRWIFAVCLVMLLCGTGAADPITTEVSFDQAIQSQDPVIELGNSFTLSGSKQINFQTSIVGNGYTLSCNGQLFEVLGGANVTFNNVALTATGGNEAVKITDGNVTFTGGTSFAGSTTKAVDIAASNAGTVAFAGTQFTSIHAPGGVVSVAGGTVNFNPSSGVAVKFENNTSGVALTVSGGIVKLPGAQFVGNAAGAVSITGGNVAFTGNTFRNNTGAVNGGAISVTGGTITFSGTDTFLFVGNTATNNGGAIYNTTRNAMPANATFSNNTAANDGGAIYTTQPMVINGGAFSGNMATNGSGGMVYSVEAITISDTTLSGSRAGTNGGAVYAGGIAAITGSILNGNEAGGAGGAVYSAGVVTVTDSVLSGNTATTGGAIACPAVVATGASFRGNTLTGTNGAGGAVYIGPIGSVTAASTIEQCLFVNQFTQGNGGAVFLQGSNTTVDIRQCHFEGNAAGNGGGLYLMGSSAEISRSTFDGNKATTGQGGAAFLASSSRAGVINCTFINNESAGQGGAVCLDAAIRGEMSAVYYSTFVGNKGTGGGGALYTRAGTLALGATAMVGNTGNNIVADLLRENSSTITSLGNSIVESYGVSQGGSMTGSYQWVSDPGILGTTANKNSDIVNSTQYANLKSALFGSNGLADNTTSGLTTIMTGSEKDSAGRIPLRTIALAATTATQVNPALDKINGDTAYSYVRSYFSNSRTHVDERGVLRGASAPQPAGGLMADVGAFELPTENGGGETPGTGTVAYVVMGGIPNTMVRIGQTCTLAAVVYDQNGQTASDQGVTWESSRPRVAAIDGYGNLVSLSGGTTTITVTTVAYGTNYERKSASATLTVSEPMTYNNVHPDVLGRFADFNETLSSKGVQVYFHDADPSKVEGSSFVAAFVGEYGLTPRQVTSLSGANDIDFVTNLTYSGLSSELRPSVGVSAANFSGYGSLLPLRYVYSLSWSEVSSILGRTVTSASASDIRSLFDQISLVFVGEDRTEQTVLDGRNVSDALSSGALSFTNGGVLSLQIDALIGDAIAVGRSASGRADMINGCLVVADNVANQKIDGEMWLVGKAGSSSGGGGCTGFASPLLFALFAPALLVICLRKERANR